MSLFARLLTWWRGPTLATTLFTRGHGREVGRDSLGNIYYETADGGRRWVIYPGENDSSRVPPEWHLWLHRTRREPPTEAPLPARPWERPWRPNPTGTALAERPPGALETGGQRSRTMADYRAWTPET